MKKTFSNDEMFGYVQLASRLHETGKLGFAIAKNTRKMRDELKEYMEKRNELLTKHGTPDAKIPGRYELSKEARKQYEAEIGEYGSLEAEVEVMQVLEEEFMGGSLTNTQMEALMWMVQEDREERK